jgi:hypothetical protein
MSVREVINNIKENNLDEAKQNMFKVLSEKAALKLKEMKIEKASDFFGKK